ncbi:MAG TPA: fibronectin type III domain-containing protein, partial [Thermotogota bacterium]|nr:fibronectin type III domain-containing protein [Thermotogota bacterium]
LDGFFVYFAKDGQAYPGPQWVTAKELEKEQLAYGTTYKWKVVVVQSDGQSATSTERTFRTIEMIGVPEIELVGPADFATDQATSLTLTWEATPGSETSSSRAENLTGYDVYLAKASEAYGSPVAVTEKELTRSNLEYGTQYKWKVVAKQSDGKSSASEQWVFTTVAPEYTGPEIALDAPADSATDQATSLLLTWEATAGTFANTGARPASLQGYFVYVGQDGQDYPGPQWTTAKELEKQQLAYGTTYKWQVVAVQSDGQVATSTERTFSTIESSGGPEIELVGPASFATDQATSLTLTWEATPGAQASGARALSITGYDVYLAKASETYGSPVAVTDKELARSNLEYGTQYKWKVVAKQSDGKSAASEQWVFTTADQEYTGPEIALDAPADSATDQATSLTLTWEATAGTVANTGARLASLQGYFVYVGKDGQDYPEPQWATEKQMEKSNLEYNATYKWQVVVVQSDGQVATSTERTFSTIESSGIPEIELVGPANFATDQATSLTLTWEATPGALTSGTRAVSLTGYDVYLAKASEAYGSPVAVTDKELAKSNLEYATQYKWKVVAKQSDGKSTASEQWVFTTVGESYNLPQLTLETPGNASEMVSLNPTLTWEATPGTQSNTSARAVSIENYEVYFAKVGDDYASPTIVETKSLAKVNLDPYTQYKWKVTA